MRLPHSGNMRRSIAYAIALRAAAAALADVGGGGEPTAAGATTAAGAAAGGTTATAGGVMDPAIGGRGADECWDRDVFCDFCDGCDCCELGRQGLQKNAAQTRSVFREFYTTPASGQQKRAKFPTSKAHISAVFHSFRLIFGRAIISRNGLEAWMLFPERARAEHSR